MQVKYTNPIKTDDRPKYNTLKPYLVYCCVEGPEGYLDKHLYSLVKSNTTPYGVWLDLSGILADMTQNKERCVSSWLMHIFKWRTKWLQ